MYLELCLPVKSFEFAEDIVSIAGGLGVSGQEATAFIPEIWANTALGRLRSQTCMAALASRDFEDEIASQGDTVNIPKRGVLYSNKKSPHKPVKLQAPSADTIPVVMDNHQEVSFLIEDVAAAQANQSILEGYVDDAAIVLGEDIDVALLGEYEFVDAANVIDCSVAGKILESHILTARTLLKITGKSGNRPRYLIIKDLAELVTIDHLINKDFIDRAVIPEDNVGSIHGFEVYENNNLIEDVSPPAAHRLVFVQGAITLVTRRLPNPPANVGVQAGTVIDDNIALRALYGYNMNYLGMQITIDILFGTKIIRQEWVAEITESV